MDGKENIDNLTNEVQQLIKTIKKRSDAGEYFCIQAEGIEALGKNQQIILENQERLEGKQQLIKKSQDRMFQLIQGIERRLGDGDKRFQKIEEFVTEKKAKNGFRDKQIDKVESELKEKATEKELDEKAENLDEKIDRVEELLKEIKKEVSEDVENIRLSTNQSKEASLRNIIVGAIGLIASLIVLLLSNFLR